ncbi:MAG: uracil-DNA glycosylase [Pseudomonadota bacterium]
MIPLVRSEPRSDCDLCMRLAAFRSDNTGEHPGYFNAPVPSFGSREARLLIVGLAPGLHGANQTGRPFTGDYAGDLLYPTLIAQGFAAGPYGARADDGLRLVNCRITNAVRCVPPQNKPTPAEIRTCNGFLAATLDEMPSLTAVLALGRIAHDAVLRARGLKLSAHHFGHGATHDLGAIQLFDSYHCSRYNTNTGRLTEAMFDAVIGAIRRYLAD